MNYTTGPIKKAIKVIVYGTEGIGKSTFAAQFPDPVFIDTEGSTAMMNVKRTPTPASFAEIISQVQYIARHPGEAKTLVIDTIDWAERMAIKSICDAKHLTGIEDAGYGKGYVYVYEDLGRLLNALNECIDAGINVVLTAHAAIRKFEQPDELGSYDRWELKCLNAPKANVCAMLKEWADMVLFVNWKTITVKSAESKKTKATGGTERVMYAQHRAAFDAKNRFGLPEELPFTFESIAQIFSETHTEAVFSASEPSVDAGNTNTLPEPAKPENTLSQAPSSAKNALDDEPNIPKALRDLMINDEVKPFELRMVVEQKGYMPTGTLISDYPLEFVNEWCIPFWTRIVEAVKQNRAEIPFFND